MMTEHEEKFRSQRQQFFKSLLSFIVNKGPIIAGVGLACELLFAPFPFGRADTGLCIALLYAIVTLQGAKFTMLRTKDIDTQIKALELMQALTNNVGGSIKIQKHIFEYLSLQIKALQPDLSPEERKELILKISEKSAAIHEDAEN
jgi:hypothetical protein